MKTNPKIIMKTLQKQIEELQHEYAGIPDNHAETCECSICEFPKRIMKILANREEEIVKEVKDIIKLYIPTDSMGDYGGSGAMSDVEICDMFINGLFPQLDDLTENRGSE